MPTMSAPPSQPPRSADTFAALVEGVIAHPLFPVVIKKVFDICNLDTFKHSYLIPHFTEHERNALSLQHFAAKEGLHKVCDMVSSTDVFMSTMVAALNEVLAADFRDPRFDELVALRSTISTGQKALGITTDPRFVGATDSRQAEVRRTELVSHHAATERPDRLRPVGHAVQRTGGTQLWGIQKPAPRIRQPLSDKAKATLERWFQEHLENPYPSSKEKEELATLCEITMSSVNNWFGNKRMRIKRKIIRAEGTGDSSIRENVLAPQSKWNAVVVSKMTSPAGREVLANATGQTLSPDQNSEIKRQGHAQEQVGPSGPGRPNGPPQSR